MIVLFDVPLANFLLPPSLAAWRNLIEQVNHQANDQHEILLVRLVVVLADERLVPLQEEPEPLSLLERASGGDVGESAQQRTEDTGLRMQTRARVKLEICVLPLALVETAPLVGAIILVIVVVDLIISRTLGADRLGEQIRLFGLRGLPKTRVGA